MSFFGRLINRWVKVPVASSVLGSLIRHGVGWLGVWLTASGFSEATVSAFVNSTTEIVIGLLAMGISLILSQAAKK